ncbi:hypothetical protein [Candidatus Williamhamiltonella defendens]|nr:hypothetical protein [Candidatus Hamiltonella defensa]
MITIDFYQRENLTQRTLMHGKMRTRDQLKIRARRHPPPSFTLNAPKDAPDAVKALVTLDNRPEYELELIDNQGVFTVEMPLAEGPHELKVKFIDPDGDWIRLDKTFTIDASSERIVSSLETPDRYQSDLSAGSKTGPSKENADILMKICLSMKRNLCIMDKKTTHLQNVLF